MTERNEVLWGAPQISDKTVGSWVVDRRDIPVARVVFDMFALWVIPGLASFLFDVPVWMYAAYLAGRVWYLVRYTGTIHVAAHRRLFKYRVFNYFEPVASCFFGIPGGIYYTHHVKMHHVGDNVLEDDDLSSTMYMQRDTVGGLLKYLAFVWLRQIPYLPVSAVKHGTKGDAFYFFACMSTYIYAMRVLWSFNSYATLWVFVVPSLLFPFLIFTGNYAQHLLLHPKWYINGFGNTFTCVGEVNTISFNDVYYANHHLKATMHWSLHPKYLADNMGEYGKHDSIIFKDVGGHVEVLWYVLTGNYRRLYDCWMPIDKPRSYDEFVEMIHERCRPIKP